VRGRINVVTHASPSDSSAVFAAEAVLVVPLRVASGVRMKILEAWARGIPVVTTPEAAAGLEAADGSELLLARDAIAFAFAVQHLWWIRTREREASFRAFLDNHWLGFAVFSGVALDFAVHLHRWPRVW